MVGYSRRAAPRNGIRISGVTIISGARFSRDMEEVFKGGQSRTFAFPQTVVVVREESFKNMKDLRSVKLNSGLELLECQCFCNSGIREVIIPASVYSISKSAFYSCTSLRYADLSAAHNLKELEPHTFNQCE